MYRGQDIVSRKDLTETCIARIYRGRIRQLYAVLPHISLIRSKRFVPPLCSLLRKGDRDQKQFAAMALGAVGDSRSIGPLCDALRDPAALLGSGTQSLQTAVIFALGETGSTKAVAPLMEIFHLKAHDSYTTRRRRHVICALGTLLQYGVRAAQEQLLQLSDSPHPSLRTQAAIELGVAFWHDPQHLPRPVFERLSQIADNRKDTANDGAMAALYNLAELGCPKARRYFG